MDALQSLMDVAAASVEIKPRLPDAWFEPHVAVASDPDFAALHPSVLTMVSRSRTWVELKVFRQYEAVFLTTLNKQVDVGHMIAIHTRQVAEIAHARGDTPSLELCLRYLNTYLRACINHRDLRTAYNVFNEYRDLCETILGEETRAIVLDIANRFKYYGLQACRRQLPFVLEVAAYDLAGILERADELDLSFHDDLLTVFLDLDHAPDADHPESSLRGVRKAQVKLATYYLEIGKPELARRVFHDLQDETPTRLRSILRELSTIEDAQFWEMTDRGVNFDWLPPARRRHLQEFFSWFEGEPGAAPIS